MKNIPLSRLNFSFEHDGDREKNTLPSLTTPDQTMSLREMISRYTRGQSIPTFDPVYDQDEDMPDISKMSKIELEELRQDVRGEIFYQQNELDKKVQEAADEHAKASKESKKPAAKRKPKKATPPPPLEVDEE